MQVYMLNIISDDLTATAKMPYASSVTTVANALKGLRNTFQIMDQYEMDEAIEKMAA